MTTQPEDRATGDPLVPAAKYPLPELGGQAERRWLSLLLFSAREQIDMWGDVIEHRTGVRDQHTDGIRDAIDQYRRAKGWPEHGFGGEA